ncbi:glycosyltransferase family 2 protein [Thermogladius sp. 4427co]|uniref:glycosyltransferase family 2 protein n=1 Tax=Thermogladius sp. 4427co TaxID=3450718 RepID=UPI003F78FC85
MKVCIYGTVYNNAEWVEASVKSVWRPDAEIVVVDNYSTDGTWEKLLELRKDYNLRVYRYKCSRGLGRHIALYKCPENSVASYFDLDTIYNTNFHKAIDAYEEYGSVKYIGGLVVSREEALKKGGWRDLNAGEDTEFAVRMNPRIVAPVLAGVNAALELKGVFREKRYANRLGYLKRLIKMHVDGVRASGFNIWEILEYRSKRLIALLPVVAPWTFRNYRLISAMDNASLDFAIGLFRLVDPRTLGMDDSTLLVIFNYSLVKKIKGGEEAIERVIRERLGRGLYRIKTKSRSFYLMYVRDPRVFYKIPMPALKIVGLDRI